MSIGFLRGSSGAGKLPDCQSEDDVKSIERKTLALGPKTTGNGLSDFGLRSVLLCDFSLSYIRISRKVGEGQTGGSEVGRWSEAYASLVRLDSLGRWGLA